MSRRIHTHITVTVFPVVVFGCRISGGNEAFQSGLLLSVIFSCSFFLLLFSGVYVFAGVYPRVDPGLLIINEPVAPNFHGAMKRTAASTLTGGGRVSAVSAGIISKRDQHEITSVAIIHL